MCLTLFIEPKIAKKDIIVYKVVRKTSSKTKFRALYYNDFVYTLGKYHKPDVCFFKPTASVGYAGTVMLEFHNGLHSYETLRQAQSGTGRTKVVLQCVIPKGTQYFYSHYAGTKEYVSMVLRVDKIIKEKTNAKPS